ncbi:hypothetical protein ACFRIB_41090 [Streptomyces mirabilis]|uniref:hypothetical protein n=1 Tax=Streptomyces mirabilis TaxID=68239 RepID=UPI0036C8C0A0
MIRLRCQDHGRQADDVLLTSDPRIGEQSADGGKEAHAHAGAQLQGVAGNTRCYRPCLIG